MPETNETQPPGQTQEQPPAQAQGQPQASQEAKKERCDALYQAAAVIAEKMHAIKEALAGWWTELEAVAVADFVYSMLAGKGFGIIDAELKVRPDKFILQAGPIELKGEAINYETVRDAIIDNLGAITFNFVFAMERALADHDLMIDYVFDAMLRIAEIMELDETRRQVAALQRIWRERKGKLRVRLVANDGSFRIEGPWESVRGLYVADMLELIRGNLRAIIHNFALDVENKFTSMINELEQVCGKQ